MLCAISLLALPAVIGSSAEQILGLAVSLASVQAGQAAAVQTMGSLKLRKWVLLVVLFALMSAAVLLSDSGPISGIAGASSILLGISGLLVGLKSGQHASRILQDGSPVKYQGYILQRNVFWVVTVLVFAALNANWVIYGTTLAWIVTLLSLRSVTTCSGKSQLAAVMGAVAALVYRNDINVARSMAPIESFQAWHYTFIAYATVQALTGFLIINELFSRREELVVGLRPKHVHAVAASIVVFASVAFAINVPDFDRSAPFNVTTAIALFPLGVLVSIQAALAHILSRSKTVYSAGLAGMAALVAAAVYGLGPAVGMAVELTVSGVILGVSMLWHQRSRAYARDEPNVLLEKTK
ncbi:hypothetical protein CH281_23445 [Rhodococcus sp. 06-221-2]|nr:hypothetical protein CH281_23445 [Rhodococcus sp. 06-221-2]